MNHYDVIVIGGGGRWPLKGGASCRDNCQLPSFPSGEPVFGGGWEGHDRRESAADAPETDGVFHLVGARIQQI